MKAVLALAADTPVVVENIDLGAPGDHDVLVRTEASGVCHTDVSIARGQTHQPFPIVLGHEGAGTVLEVGRQVTRCRPGDRVVMSWSTQCGDCYYCRRRQGHLCANPGARGERVATRADGGKVPLASGLGTFAEQMRVSELSVVPVVTDLPFEQLALVGCGVTTGVGSVLWTARTEPGSSVAVFGCGAVGLSVIQGAIVAGATRIFAVDVLANRRESALRFGATDTLDPTIGDVTAQLREATEGRGVDYAFEVVGKPSVLRQAFDSTRRGGTAVAVGMPSLSAQVEIPIVPLFTQEKRLIGSFYGSAQVREHFPMIVEWAERGRLDLASLVTQRITLDEVGTAFATLDEGRGLRSVIVPAL